MPDTNLIIAIDETGDFSQAKLSASEGKPSGIAAVLTTKSWEQLKRVHIELAKRHGLHYPKHFHRMDLLKPDFRRRMELEFTNAEAKVLVADLQTEMAKHVEAFVGVYGVPRGRIYFHEQEAYGEALLALLEHVHDQHKAAIHAADTVEVRIATRSHRQLTGFWDADEYAEGLEKLVAFSCRHGGWPKALKVATAGASRDPHLILVDFFASDAVGAAWSKNLEDSVTPSLRRVAAGLLTKATPASRVLIDLVEGREPARRALLDLSAQDRHGALSLLIETAHAQVRGRGGSGSMDVAQRLVDYLWEVVGEGVATHFQGQLCAIAAEICSHQGLSDDSEAAVRWQQRTASIGAGGWGTNALERRANRLAHEIQAAQTTFFNVFDFEGAYLAFEEELENYAALAGGEDALEGDELYGKILGTLGQACGFLRAVEPAIGNEAWSYIARSTPCFKDSEPVFRAMNLGYRLTDLWDRGDLDACAALMAEERLPKAKHADPYALLHLLRLAAAQKSSGTNVESAALTKRLLELVGDESTAGKTPFDLCLKWALYLEPDNSALRVAAKAWFAKLEPNQVAILATSLALVVQCGDHDLAEQHLEVLKAIPGFAVHWKTDRSASLAACIADRTAPNYAALRAMPWNYA